MNKWYINGIEMTNRCIFLTSDYTVYNSAKERTYLIPQPISHFCNSVPNSYDDIFTNFINSPKTVI